MSEKLLQAKYSNFDHDNVSFCSLCQVENEHFGRNNFSQYSNTCQVEKISQADGTPNSKNCKTRNSQYLAELSKLKNCQYLKMFQVAPKLPYNVGSYIQSRITDDFLSSRETA